MALATQVHPALGTTDIVVNWSIFGVALGVMAAGLGLFFWGVRKRSLPYLRTTNPIIWALVAMGPALVLFSVFPDSSAEGKIGAFQVGGAFAAFALVWFLGIRLTREGIDADGELERLRDQVAAAGAGSRTGDPVISTQERVRYRVRGSRGRDIVVVTGDLANVRDADVWVSP